jgi:hypothetical protein
MPTNCKKGEIWRVAHTRKLSKKSSRKNSKKKASRILVSGKCIKSTSQTGVKMSNISRQKMEEKKLQHEIAREKFGTPKCPKGKVVKEGYKKTSKSGKSVWIKPTCVNDVGKKGKQERVFIVEPGRLSKYGYNDVEERSDLARHKSLRSAFDAGEKPLSVSRRLNALATLTKNTNPIRSQIFKRDSEWIKLTNEYKLERAK